MNNAAGIDALADVLKSIRLSGSAYFCADFASPWGMNIDAGNQGLFHVVIKGSCYLQLEGNSDLLPLNEGDIVAFPTGGGHWVSDNELSQRLPGGEVVQKVMSGNNPFAFSEQQTDDEVDFTLLCGSFEYDAAFDHPFLKDLPCFIHVIANETPELEWLRSMVTVLSHESRNPSPGSSLVVDRLTEVLFIQLMRFYMANTETDLGYMAALADKQIGKALNLIHGERSAELTVEGLGDAVALSRTAFTEKFSKMVGMPPKSYLLNWRMQSAKGKLLENVLSTYEIAERAGYSSEAAFSKAFKQFFLQTPGQVRRQ